MLSVHLEDRFRESIGLEATEGRDDSIRFAVDFTRLLARILPDDISRDAFDAMRDAIDARTELNPNEITVLLDLALTPENQESIEENELRAYGGRFGAAEEVALRAALSEEGNLQSFASRYGSAEALLLLDSLFRVCAVDGLIDRGEIGRLQQAASDLGIDPMLVGALFRKHDVRHASGDFTFDISDGDSFIVGRANAASIQLPDPQVGLRHAQIVRSPEGFRVIDLASGRPTLVNGNPIQSSPLSPGDDLRVGPYTLNLDQEGRTLTAFGLKGFSALSVRNLTRHIGQIQLLDEVSFSVFSGEVIALVGPSGSGKTTLLNAIAGIAAADSGDVLMNARDFHSLLANDRSMVGIVPQEDVVHAELGVAESLFYAGRLRFPKDVGTETINVEVDRVLDELGIKNIQDSRIGSALRRGISGGQRKRVNLGQELLTRSTKVLFLDEPTSGLDPQTAQDIVSLVRQLADDGRIAFIVTHDVSPSIMSLVDHLLVLAPGGRVAWFGPPSEACTWFNVDSPDQIFARLPDKTPTEWKTEYRQGYAYRKFVRTREHLVGLDGVESTKNVAQSVVKRSALLQYLTLTRRYAKVKMRDYTGTGVLLSQAPILGVAIWIVFPQPDIATMFMLVLSVLWFGASDSVRELIAERTIWRRESRVGLKLLPYMASKLTVLGFLVSLQCLMLTGIVYWSLDMGSYGFSFWALSSVCIGTGWVGLSMGLLVSSIFSSSEAAVGTLPLLLIPQIAFGGLIVKVKDMSEMATIVAYGMITRYAFETSIKTGTHLSKPAVKGVSETKEHIKRFLWELGFRSSDANDMGLSMLVLGAILFGFFFVFTSLATWFTYRSREGN